MDWSHSLCACYVSISYDMRSSDHFPLSIRLDTVNSVLSSVNNLI